MEPSAGRNALAALAQHTSLHGTSDSRYGGMWYIAGEAHISTIAVHPKGRGHGWGEILLAGMVRRGIVLEARLRSPRSASQQSSSAKTL